MFFNLSTKRTMRKNKYELLVLIVSLVACSKNIDQRFVPEFEPSTIDSTGGNWKTILLSSGAEVTLAAPDAIGSAAYQSELSSIIQMQQGITQADKDLISHWKNSGIIRWNEKARELVAKYNLPPEANPD